MVVRFIRRDGVLMDIKRERGENPRQYPLL